MSARKERGSNMSKKRRIFLASHLYIFFFLSARRCGFFYLTRSLTVSQIKIHKLTLKIMKNGCLMHENTFTHCLMEMRTRVYAFTYCVRLQFNRRFHSNEQFHLYVTELHCFRCPTKKTRRFLFEFVLNCIPSHDLAKKPLMKQSFFFLLIKLIMINKSTFFVVI